MHAIIVDDEQLALRQLERILLQCTPITRVSVFTSPRDALGWMECNRADIAFLDINMGQMDGLAMARQVKAACPTCSIVFVTGHSEYAVEAFRLRASGYLLKPAGKEDVQREIDHVLHPNKIQPDRAVRVRVQCFGNFEVFVDEKPLNFGRRKSKELLAYLIDRKGAAVTTAEVTAVLFEDRAYTRSLQNQVQTIISDMMKTLRALGVEQIVVKTRGSLAIDVNAVCCDYYAFMRGDVAAINAFSNEYMSNYSWTEFTVGVLIERLRNKNK